MPEKPKSSPKRLKLSEDSKPKSSTKNDSNKRFKWKKPSNNTNKKTPKAESKTLRKVLSLLISWTDNNKKIPKSLPIWSSKNVNKRPANGPSLFRKLSPWQKPKCSKSSDQAKERGSAGREESTKSHLSERTLPVNHQNSSDSSVPWVCVSSKPTSHIQSSRQHSSFQFFQ